MSDRQVLAEFGTALCLAGLAPWAAPLVVPVAVLGAFLLDLRGKCDRRLARTATDAALKALANSPELTDSDIRTARTWLDHRRTDLRLDPILLAKAATTASLPDALLDLIVDDTLARDGGARQAVRLALTAAYQTCRTQDDFHKLFSQEVLIGLAQTHGKILQKLDTMEAALLAEMAKMQALMLDRLQSAQPQTYAAHTTMIIGLAERYARNPDGTAISDFDAAYAGLENALQVAETLRAQNALPRNATDQVDAVLAHVQALNDAAEFERADAALAAARAEARERIAEQTSGLMRLLDSAVAQATLRNRPEQAAEALVERLMLDTPVDPFEAMRLLQEEWYVRGRDKGLIFDATVAIHLAELSIARARTPDQRGAALNNVGSALLTLGAREPGAARLELAITAFAEALKECTRDRAPLEWATIQNNLGVALQTLGARKPGTALLEQAVAAYTEALKERTRNRAPLEWASTQINLGNAFWTLGQRESGTEQLEQALASYTEALKEFTRDRLPLKWAMAQHNLGTALQLLGTRELSTARLEQAAVAYTEALKERTRDNVPMDWASTQNNLGNTLLNLGALEPGTARLEEAVAAYAKALNEYMHDRAPLDWAMTQGNMANVEIAFFDKTADPAHLSAARANLLAAREVFVAAGAGHYVGMADAIMDKIDARETT